jgi:hypothetical protein
MQRRPGLYLQIDVEALLRCPPIHLTGVLVSRDGEALLVAPCIEAAVEAAGSPPELWQFTGLTFEGVVVLAVAPSPTYLCG